MKQILLYLIILFFASCYSSEPQTTGKEGKTMPEFKILSTDSITWINSQKIPTGKPTALFYFSPYCPYCKAQTEEIIEDIDKLKGIQFYFISAFPIQDLRSFSKKFQLNKYPNITLAMDANKSVTDYFEIIGVPYMAIFGKDKKLIKTYMGGKLYSSQILRTAEQ